MKFSYSWIKQLVDINPLTKKVGEGVNLPASKLAAFLSMHAFETEVVSQTWEFPNIIVARVVKVEKHPNADRLRVVELTDGKKTFAPVVCGAWNFEAGAIVALASPGAVIPHDQHDPEGKPFTLGKATIRGIESQGMICSGKELGLSSDGSGIMILDSNYKVGETFSVKNSSGEIVLDISLPANRPDLISYRGVAWEIAALTGRKYLVKNLKSEILNLKSNILKVRVSEPKLCKTYLAVRLNNIKVGPSPEFIQKRLELSGLRPINNVVDITNYAMLETGQPMHAFDAGKITGAISVRKAYVNETLVTLDGITRKLTPDMLVIADSKKAIAVAGVMGGRDSAVGENTNEVILESANFNAVSVRRTAKGLGLRTDASSRFEKSLPVQFTSVGLEYAVELIQKYANGNVLEFAQSQSKPEKSAPIKLDPEKVNQLLGSQIPASEQKKILQRFGFKTHVSRNIYHVTVPFWRPDVTLWQDLAEEIERYKGLDKIVPKPIQIPASSFMTEPIIDAEDTVRDLLVDMGFSEIYTYSFVSEVDLDRWQIDKKIVIEVANPLSLDQQYLRPALSLNALKIAEQNSMNKELTESELVESGKYFEIGNIFWKEKGNILEKTYLFMLSFPKVQKRIEELIGNFSELLSRLGVEFEIKQHEEQMAQIIVAGKVIGQVGTLADTSILTWIGVSLDFEEFIKHFKAPKFKSINRYPSVKLDTSIIVREDIPWIEIKKTILSSHQKLISQIILMESSYRGKDISAEKKSMTFRIVYQAANRTLTKDEVNNIHSQVLSALKSKFSAQVRE